MYMLLGAALYYLPDLGIRGVRIDLIAELGRLVFVAAIPTLLMARVEGRPFGSYGLPRQGGFGKLFWGGAVWGIGALTVLMLCMHWAGVFDFGSVVLHGGRLVKFAAFWGFVFLLVGLQEELLFRGYPQSVLTEGVGFWPAAVLGSMAFGGIHFWNPGENWIGLSGAALIGLFFCLTLRRTGNLWFAVGFHAAWDYGESFIYSVPDSGSMVPGHLMESSFRGPAWLTGGSIGPEGSVFVFVLIGLLCLAFDRLNPEVRFPAVTAPASTVPAPSHLRPPSAWHGDTRADGRSPCPAVRPEARRRPGRAAGADRPG